MMARDPSTDSGSSIGSRPRIAARSAYSRRVMQSAGAVEARRRHRAGPDAVHPFRGGVRGPVSLRRGFRYSFFERPGRHMLRTNTVDSGLARFAGPGQRGTGSGKRGVSRGRRPARADRPVLKRFPIRSEARYGGVPKTHAPPGEALRNRSGCKRAGAGKRNAVHASLSHHVRPRGKSEAET